MGVRHNSPLEKRNNVAGLVFMIPLILFFACIIGFSIFFLIKNSFFRVTIAFKNPEPVKFGNYISTLSDSQFYRALLNTFLLAGANIFFGITLGFLIATFLQLKLRGKKFFHALFFIPSMLPVALMAAIFNSMLQYKEGTLNELLRALGLGFMAQRWIADTKLAMLSVMGVSIFLIGVPIMYYTADLTTINTSIIEAARIDGANLWQTITRVIFPMFKRTHKTIVLSMILGGFRAMDQVYLMTDGGPGGATDIIGTYIYRTTRAPGSNIGRVCSVAVLVLIIAFAFGFVQMKAATGRGGRR